MSTAATAPDRRHAFVYATLRAVPRVDRGEFVNVGVILYCQALDYLAASVVLDPVRLRAIAPDVDVDAVRTSAEAVVVACRTPVGLARENEGQAAPLRDAHRPGAAPSSSPRRCTPG